MMQHCRSGGGARRTFHENPRTTGEAMASHPADSDSASRAALHHRGVHPYDEVRGSAVTLQSRTPRRHVAFEQLGRRGARVLSVTPPTPRQKYFRGTLAPLTARPLLKAGGDRVADASLSWGLKDGYFATKRSEITATSSSTVILRRRPSISVGGSTSASTASPAGERLFHPGGETRWTRSSTGYTEEA